MANGHSDPHVCQPECDHTLSPFHGFFTEQDIQARYAATRLPALKAELRKACSELRNNVDNTLGAIEEYIKLQEDFAARIKS